MIFFILILLAVIVRSSRTAPAGSFQKDYLSRENTGAVKGIFVILVLFSHFSQYVTLKGRYDAPYLALRSHLDQMVVAMFLFYSGYGMVSAIRERGYDYVKTIPVKRFLRVWITFAVTVGLFLAVDLILGIPCDLPTAAWSLIGWKSVGNSNWYMFLIFVLYWLLFLSFLGMRRMPEKPGLLAEMAIFSVLSVLFVLFEIRMGLPAYWYNTAVLFALGGWYALFHEKIEKAVMANDLAYTLTCTAVVILYLVSFQKRGSGIEVYTVWAAAFTMLVVLLTMKVTFGGPVLAWFGDHVFSVYMLQRIPMIILHHFGLSADHRYLFLILSLLLTILLAMAFDTAMAEIRKRLAAA